MILDRGDNPPLPLAPIFHLLDHLSASLTVHSGSRAHWTAAVRVSGTRMGYAAGILLIQYFDHEFRNMTINCQFQFVTIFLQ